MNRNAMTIRTFAKYFGVLALVGLVAACGGGGGADAGSPPATGTAPVITSFSSADTVLAASGSTTLSAVFSGGTGIIMPGSISITSGVPVDVAPKTSTLYTLTVTGGSGQSVSRSVAVYARKPVELVSLGNTGTPATTNAYLARATTSADGRFVVFVSQDDALTTGDSNGTTDIFLRDREQGTTTRISATPLGGSANGDSDRPVISANGCVVAFESHAGNLVDGVSTAGVKQIYRYNRCGTPALLIVSVKASDGLPNIYNSSYTPSLSADGSQVVFASDAQLTTEYPTGTSVYMRNIQNNTTTLVSRTSGGAWVSGTNPVISADGSTAVFESLGNVTGNTNGAWQLYTRNINSGTVSLVSTNAAGSTLREQGNESASRAIQASLSADGARVSFCTTANNLVPAVTPVGNLFQNVFVKAVASGEIITLSKSAAAVSGNGDSVRSQGGRAPISANGTWVVYNTNATNLAGGGQYSTLLANALTGEREVVHAGSATIGDTDPFISPDAWGRFVLLRSQDALDPARPGSRGIFLVDRHMAPVADAGMAKRVTAGSVELDGSGSSAAPNTYFTPAPALSYRWIQVSGPTSVSLSSTTATKPTFTAAITGTYVFRLVVDDTFEESLPSETSVKVQ